MSIVEKALSKLQGARTAGVKTEIRSRPLEAKVVAPRPEVPARPAPLVRNVVPRQRITLNLARLQAAGVLPSGEAAVRVRDEFRRICWPLLKNIDDRTPGMIMPNLIAVTSALPNEGKTTMTLNLALCLSNELERRVLLIDGDVRKPQLSRLLGLDKRPGFLDHLADEARAFEESLFATEVERLILLAAGSRSGDTAAFVASRRLEQMLQALADSEPNRIVLLDCPPLLPTSEAQVLGRLAGQVVMVVRAGHTLQPAVLEAIHLLEGAGNVSCVLNQVEQRGGGDYHSRYYGFEDENKNKS